MGEYSSKKSLSYQIGVFKNSYIADKQNGQFSQKISKSLERTVKWFENYEKMHIFKRNYKFKMNFVQKTWKTGIVCPENMKKKGILT